MKVSDPETECHLKMCINASKSYVHLRSCESSKTFLKLHDLNDIDEKTKMLKTPSLKSNRVKSYASFKS